MAEDLKTALRRVPLFANIGDRELGRLANQFNQRSFAEGTTVTAEGASGVGFFMVLEGNATVSVGGQERRTLGPGDHFGEVALLDEGTRTATIVAATDLRCAGLTAWEFRPFIENHPAVAWPLLQALARELRSAEAARGSS
jgi:CRP/FNR family cyclic AMP-dependent transcriptional regulator